MIYDWALYSRFHAMRNRQGCSSFRSIHARHDMSMELLPWLAPEVWIGVVWLAGFGGFARS